MYRVFDTVCIVIRSEAAHLDAVKRGTPLMRTVGMEYAISLHTHELGNEPGLVSLVTRIRTARLVQRGSVSS
jgi:hypothetical protein